MNLTTVMIKKGANKMRNLINQLLNLPIGSRTLLFGCHQFILHPLYTWWGWRYLYGGRSIPQMALVFIIHDWGYWGMDVIDGDEDDHPRHSAKLYFQMARWGIIKFQLRARYNIAYHSRFYAREVGVPPAPLCWADKMGTALTPSWLWALLAHLSGEGYVYMANQKYEIVQNGSPLPHSIRGLYLFHRRYKQWAFATIPGCIDGCSRA